MNPFLDRRLLLGQISASIYCTKNIQTDAILFTALVLVKTARTSKRCQFFCFCAGEIPRAVALPRVMISNHVDAVLYTTIKQHFIYNNPSRFHFDHSTERPFFLEF